MEISSLDLSNRLNFIATFIALYESFSDYIIECPKQLFNADIIVKNNQYAYIKKQDELLKKRTELSKYKYIKFTQHGYTQWLNPEYDKRIKSKKIKVQGKNQSNILFNSIMFFIEENVLEENDFNKFLEIRDLRNKLVHEMPKLILLPTEKIWENMLEELTHMYKKVNNYWCVILELSIAENNVPQNIKIDFDNIITTDLYNLLIAIDVLFNTKFVIDKQWIGFNGLYKGLCLPIINENMEEH